MLETLESPGAYSIIVSNALEIVLFGTYTILFTFALIILTIYRRPLPIDWGMVIATTLLYTFCMSHCSIVTTDRHTTFTSHLPMPTGKNMSGLLRVGDILFKTCGFISQLVMIHRCWAVWDYRNSVVFIPVVMALAGFACALVGPTRMPRERFISPFVAPRMLPLDITFCVLSLLVYVLVTVLITVHLWRVSAPVRNVKSMETLIWSLVGACIEAGALLLIAQLSVVVFLALEHPALIIAEGIAAQVYGIAPTMMIMRLGLSLLPRGRRRWDTSTPQFSTLLETFYSSEESEDIEMGDTPVSTVKPPALVQ